MLSQLDIYQGINFDLNNMLIYRQYIHYVLDLHITYICDGIYHLNIHKCKITLI